MMGLHSAQITAVAAAVTVFILRQILHVSWFWSVPLYALYFILWHGFRMLIYDRYFTPLAKLPGPKVRNSCNSNLR